MNIDLNCDFEFKYTSEDMMFLEIKNEILKLLATEDPIPLAYLATYNGLVYSTPLQNN